MADHINLYEVLGIDRGASTEWINEDLLDRLRRLRAEGAPEHGEEFQKTLIGQGILGDEELRRAYDERLADDSAPAMTVAALREFQARRALPDAGGTPAAATPVAPIAGPSAPMAPQASPPLAVTSSWPGVVKFIGGGLAALGILGALGVLASMLLRPLLAASFEAEFSDGLDLLGTSGDEVASGFSAVFGPQFTTYSLVVALAGILPLARLLSRREALTRWVIIAVGSVTAVAALSLMISLPDTTVRLYLLLILAAAAIAAVCAALPDARTWFAGGEVPRAPQALPQQPGQPWGAQPQQPGQQWGAQQQPWGAQPQQPGQQWGAQQQPWGAQPQTPQQPWGAQPQTPQQPWGTQPPQPGQPGQQSWPGGRQ